MVSLFELGDWIVGEAALAKALGLTRPELRARIRSHALPGLMSLPEGSGMKRDQVVALKRQWAIEQATAQGITEIEAQQEAQQMHKAIINALTSKQNELSEVRTLTLALDALIREMRLHRQEMAALREAMITRVGTRQQGGG
jgi:predicted DsbA family dithiol-disulfide isomerase